MGFKILIVGGGLSGLTLANGLLKHGSDLDLEIEIYERDAKDLNREGITILDASLITGYEIRMGEDGLTGLRTSLLDTEWNSVKSKLGVGGKAAPQICDLNFRSIFDLGSLLTYPESMPIQRGRLRESLLVQPERRNLLHFSKTVTNYAILREGPSERVQLFFKDGTSTVGDLVIAADGSKSILNEVTGLCNRYVTDVRCITARINLTRPDIVRSLPPTLQVGPVMLGLGGRSVCFSSLYLPVQDDGSSVYHKSSTLMWALAVGAEFWKKTLGYDPEELGKSEKFDQQEWFETALDLAEHWHSPALKSVLTADPVASIGYGAFRSSVQPSLDWRMGVRGRLGADAAHDRIWFMGDSMHAMTRTLSFLFLVDLTLIVNSWKRNGRKSSSEGCWYPSCNAASDGERKLWICG